jgi:hypothetical protein
LSGQQRDVGPTTSRRSHDDDASACDHSPIICDYLPMLGRLRKLVGDINRRRMGPMSASDLLPIISDQLPTYIRPYRQVPNALPTLYQYVLNFSETSYRRQTDLVHDIGKKSEVSVGALSGQRLRGPFCRLRATGCRRIYDHTDEFPMHIPMSIQPLGNETFFKNKNNYPTRRSISWLLLLLLIIFFIITYFNFHFKHFPQA